MARHHPGLLRPRTTRLPQGGSTSSVSVLGRPALAIPAALVLVSPERRRLLCDGESAGGEAERLLARLRGPICCRCFGWDRIRSAPASSTGDRGRLRDEDDHA